MAVSLIAGKGLLSIPTPPNSFGVISPKRRRYIGVVIRSSDETTEISSESIEEAPPGPPSIISALNVERALRGIPITDVDHYGTLGLSRKCSYDEIMIAFKNKSDELISQGLESEELQQKIELLKESFSILSTREERRLYDWSLARSESTESYIWPYEVDTIIPPQEEPPAQEPEDFGPTRAVGYFLLGWLVLSIVTSIALNLLQSGPPTS